MSTSQSPTRSVGAVSGIQVALRPETPLSGPISLHPFADSVAEAMEMDSATGPQTNNGPCEGHPSDLFGPQTNNGPCEGHPDLSAQGPAGVGEPAWKKVKGRKRSFSSSSGGPTTSNAVPSGSAQRPTQPPSDPFKMPPIVLEAPKAWHSLVKTLKQSVDFPLEVFFQGKFLRIRTRTPDEFRLVQRTLLNSSVRFHTFGLPQEKEMKVTIRGIPHDVNPSHVLEELESIGFSPTACVPLTDRHKRKVNVFLVKLKKVGDYQLIYSLRELLCLRVEVSRFNPPTGPPQCFNCQRYGHASYNCHLTPRCVRCGLSHPKGDCKKSPEEDPKCANCGEKHPANYRGCFTYKSALQRKKELDELRNRVPTLPQRQLRVQQTAKAAKPAPPSVVRPIPAPEPPALTISFAAAAASTSTKAPPRAKAPPKQPKKKASAPPLTTKPTVTAQQSSTKAQKAPTKSEATPVPSPAPKTSALPHQSAVRSETASKPESLLTVAQVLAWMDELFPKLLAARDLQSLVTAIMTSMTSLLLARNG